MFIYIYIYIYVYKHKYMYVYLFTYTYTYIYIYLCIYIYMYVLSLIIPEFQIRHWDQGQSKSGTGMPFRTPTLNSRQITISTGRLPSF